MTLIGTYAAGLTGARGQSASPADVKARIREAAARHGVKFDANGDVIMSNVKRPAPTDGGPDCPTCSNLRFVSRDGNRERCPDCGVAAGWAARSLNRYSSTTGRASSQTFENFNTRPRGRLDPSLELCRDGALAFADELSGWLVLYGAPGCGKSHLCAAVANRCEPRGKAVIFVTYPDLLASLKETMDSDGGATYSDRLHNYKIAPVLILDDVGAERRSDWSDGVLFEVLDYRYRNRLPTMISTNLDPFSRDDFDPRVVSRMTDAQLSMTLANTAADYRKLEGDKR